MKNNARSKSKRKSPKYPGILGQRIPPYPKSYPTLLSSTETPNDWKVAHTFWILEQQLKRIPALFAYYDIDPKGGEVAWHWLAMRLAMDHVPGFQLAEKRGAPKRGDPMPDTLPEIERMVHTKKMTVSAASKALAGKLRRKPEGIRRAYTRYQSALRVVIAPFGRRKPTDAEFKAIIEKMVLDTSERGEWDMHFVAREILRVLT